jgi:hypothetical protein
MRRGRALLLAIVMLGLVACAAIAGLEEPGGELPQTDAASAADAPVTPNDVTSIPDTAVPDAPAGDARLINLGCEAGASSLLLAYWRMDEGTGTEVRDCTQNGRKGTRSAGGSEWIPGKVGANALSFDGGQVAFGAAGFGLTGPMSVSAWVRVASFATAGRIVSKGGGSGNRGWELNVETNGAAVFKIATDPDTHREAASNPIATNAWTHLVGVYEPNVAVRLYVNGVLASSNPQAGAAQRDTTFQVLAGNRPGDSCCPFLGEVDDVRVFARALAEEDIAILAAP